MELVAEIGAANGDIRYALDVVHAAKECGFDYIKGQIYDRDRLVTRTAESYAQPGISVPVTQYEDFAKTLDYGQWEGVAGECERIGIGFFFSAFDFQAIEFGERLGVSRYKIASGDITYKQLIQRVAETGKQIIMSTGAATEFEVRRALEWTSMARGESLLDDTTIVLACSLSYPCKPEDANLLRMETLRDNHTDQVGYSDHTFGVGAIHRAHHLGAVMVEKHFTITPGAGGDHDFAITPQQMQGITWNSGQLIYDGSPELGPSPVEIRARVGARRSIVAARDLTKWSNLALRDVVMLRPGSGLEPWELDQYHGRILQEDVPAGVALQKEMF